MRAWIKKLWSKIAGAKKLLPAILSLVMLLIQIAQTDNETTTTTATFDYSQLTSVVVAVIPLFVLVAIIKLLFKSFKDVA